jgi:hypothetical protein
LGSAGRLAPAQSRRVRASGTPQCKIEAAGWLPGGSPSQSRVAAVKSDLKSNSNHFKTYSNHSNFDRLKNGLPELKKFELKYGFEDIEKVNNFLHRSFSRFRMDFK